MEADWDALRAEYLCGGVSLRVLAERCGLPPGSVAAKARKEGWALARRAAGSGPKEAAEAALPAPSCDALSAFSSTGEAPERTPLANLSRAADNVVLLADRAAQGLVNPDGRVDLDGLAKVAKILKDARDTQMAVLPAGSPSGADDGFEAALNSRAAAVWAEDGNA